MTLAGAVVVGATTLAPTVGVELAAATVGVEATLGGVRIPVGDAAAPPAQPLAKVATAAKPTIKPRQCPIIGTA